SRLCAQLALPPPPSSVCPYTTLFRSRAGAGLRNGRRGARAGGSRAGLECSGGWPFWPPSVQQGENNVTSKYERYKRAIDPAPAEDRKSTRLNSSHVKISYAVFCLKKK